MYGLLVYFEVIWYIFPRFGMFYPDKSGNPGCEPGPRFSMKNVCRRWRDGLLQSISKKKMENAFMNAGRPKRTKIRVEIAGLTCFIITKKYY
jgi:hypothetical protein